MVLFSFDAWSIWILQCPLLPPWAAVLTYFMGGEAEKIIWLQGDTLIFLSVELGEFVLGFLEMSPPLVTYYRRVLEFLFW